MQYTLWERIILANEQKKRLLEGERRAKKYVREAQAELKEAIQNDPDDLPLDDVE